MASPVPVDDLVVDEAPAPLARGKDDDDDEDEDPTESDESDASSDSDSDKGNKKPKAKRKRAKKGKPGRPKGSKNKNKKPRKTKAATQPKKRMNFTELEDENICRAWRSISQHPTVGTNQTRPDFWGKIKDAFDSLMLEALDNEEDLIPCTQQAILDQFQRCISCDTNKFNACYIIRKQMNESGKTEQDIIDDAMED